MQDNRICSKLDKVLINAEWVGEYPEYETKFLNLRATSDHSTMIVFSIKQKESKRNSFKFINFWAH